MNGSLWELISKHFGTSFTLLLAIAYILNELYGSNKRMSNLLIRTLEDVRIIKEKNNELKNVIQDIHEHVENLDSVNSKFELLGTAISQLNKISDVIISEIGSFTKDDMHIHSKLNTDIQDLKMILVEIKTILPNLQRDIDNIKYNMTHAK